MKRLIPVTALVVVLPACAPAAAGSSHSSAHATAAIPSAHHVQIQVLSNRADLISGGDALVQVVLPAGTSPASVRIELDGREVTREFATRPNGKFEGLVTELAQGRNVLTAQLGDGYGARITITNHPIGGPVFSGPQIEPWTCQAGAVDKQCNEPPHFSYLYESTSPTPSTQGPCFYSQTTCVGASSLKPYDPAHPPSDVAMTTTDQGVTVPFIVREETGYQDRDAYRIETLYQPDKPWAPWAPQPQWNHRVLILHGSNCHAAYQPTDPQWDVIPGNPAIEATSQFALGRGFAVMSTALDNSDVDCNPALQAESLVIAKEHIIDAYGEIQYTIGTGCSGGSLALQWIANAYPGIYQGLIPQCSFPDEGSVAQQVLDYQALGNYFGSASGAAAGWTPTQEAEVEGTGSEQAPLPVNSAVSSAVYFPLFVPNPSSPCKGISAAQEYQPQSNPGGVRCGILDWQIDLLGPQPQSVWDSQEKALGHGFAGNPIENVGVQYGLAALNSGQITPSQFLDLNAKVGGFNIDWSPQPKRTAADQPALANAYRTGIINEANNLDQVAIIDLRGSNDPGAAHDSYRSFTTRARLDRQFGTHANQLIWEGPHIFGDFYALNGAFDAMDHWLAAVAADSSSKSLPAKLIADKPSGVTDECYDGVGTKISNSLCPAAIVPVYGTPRTVAGEPLTTDQNKCQLVPPNRSSYALQFTDAQWAQLRQDFPNGVCDYSKPGVSQQPTIGWLTYQDASGHGIYGGAPMGPAPVSVAFGPGAHRCIATSRISVHLHHPRGQRVVRAVVYINGRFAQRRRGRNLERLTLRHLPSGNFVVRIQTITNTGRLATSERRYRACAQTRPYKRAAPRGKVAVRLRSRVNSSSRQAASIATTRSRLTAGVAAARAASGHVARAYVTVDDGTQIAVATWYPPGFSSTQVHQWPALFEMDGYQGHQPAVTGNDLNDTQFFGRIDKYVAGYAQIRGTGCSGGQFDLFSPRSAKDGYDIIENWIVNAGILAPLTRRGRCHPF